MLRQILLGLKILVADDDYMSAHATCQFLVESGAQTFGPVPSNGATIHWLRSGRELDGIVLKTELRDGPAQAALIEVRRCGIRYCLAEAGRNSLIGGLEQIVILQLPLIGSRPAELIRAAFTPPASQETAQELPAAGSGAKRAG